VCGQICYSARRNNDFTLGVESQTFPANRVSGQSDFHRLALASAVWHDVPVLNETISEQLRRESDELLETAAK
jgi:hypothetical protein